MPTAAQLVDEIEWNVGLWRRCGVGRGWMIDTGI